MRIALSGMTNGYLRIFYLYPRIFYLQARAARRGRKASKIRTSGDSLRTGWAADRSGCLGGADQAQDARRGHVIVIALTRVLEVKF